jgi:hypothetical protein
MRLLMNRANMMAALSWRRFPVNRERPLLSARSRMAYTGSAMRLSATRVIVFVLAGLIFLAALILDTTALLQLAAWWIARIPLAAWAIMLVVIGIALFAARHRRPSGSRKPARRAAARPRQQSARPRKRGQAATRRPARRTRPVR